jgi:hypothetical protein
LDETINTQKSIKKNCAKEIGVHMAHGSVLGGVRRERQEEKMYSGEIGGSCLETITILRGRGASAPPSPCPSQVAVQFGL